MIVKLTETTQKWQPTESTEWSCFSVSTNADHRGTDRLTVNKWMDEWMGRWWMKGWVLMWIQWNVRAECLSSYLNTENLQMRIKKSQCFYLRPHFCNLTFHWILLYLHFCQVCKFQMIRISNLFKLYFSQLFSCTLFKWQIKNKFIEK